MDWYARKPLAWVTTGVAGGGLVMGVLFSALAADSSASADATAQLMSDEASRRPDTVPFDRSGRYCGPRDEPSGDLPHYAVACGQLRDQLDAHDTQIALAITGFALLGVGVVGTATYALVDWYPKKAQPSAAGPAVTGLTPILSPSQAGLGVAGTF